MPKMDLSDLGIDLDAIAKRIKEQFNVMSDSRQKELKEKCGLSTQQWSNYFGKAKNRKKPSIEVIIRIAHAMDIPVDNLLFDRHIDIEEDPLCIKIPYIEPILNKDQNIVISRSNSFFLNRKFTESKKLYCMKYEGDLMKPTLKENDIILIDGSHKRIIKEGHIHVFYNPDTPFIQTKRLYLYREKIIVKTDNSSYMPYSISLDQIRIIGVVIKVFKSLI